MSTLILKIDADAAGLARLKAATDELRTLLTTTASSTNAALTKLEVQLAGVQAAAEAAKASTTSTFAAISAGSTAATTAVTTTAGALNTKLNPALTSATAKTHALRDATRGVAGATGHLWMAYGQLLPLLGAFAVAASAIKGEGLSAEFEYETKYTTSLAEATGDYTVSLGELRDRLISIKGVTDGPKELAGATRDLVKAGFSASQSVGEIAEMSKTALAVQEDLSDVTRGVAAQYRAWNAESVGAERGVTSLTQAANMMGFAALATATDFGELNAMLAHTTELGPLTGGSFAEILAALGNMTNMGIRGTKAATALRTAVLRLQNPVGSLAREFESLRVPFSAFTKDGELKNLTTLFEDLNKSLAPLTKEARTTLLADVFGLRSLKGGVAMAEALAKSVEEGKFSFRGLTEEIEKAGVALEFIDGVYQDITDTTKGQWMLLQADAARVFTEAFNDSNGEVRSLVEELRKAANDGSLRAMVDAVALLATGLTKAAKFAVEFKEEFIGIAAAIAAAKVGAAVWNIVTALRAAAIAGTAFNAVAAVNPYVLIAAALVGVVTTITLYAKAAENAALETQKLSGEMQAMHRSNFGDVVTNLGAVYGAANKKLSPDSWVYTLNKETGQFTDRVEVDENDLNYRRFAESLKNKTTKLTNDDGLMPGHGYAPGKDKRPDIVDDKIAEWRKQRELEMEQDKISSVAKLRAADTQNELSLYAAKLASKRIYDQEYLLTTRELKDRELAAQIEDVRKSLAIEEQRLDAAKKYAEEHKKDLTAQKAVATATDKVLAQADKLKLLEGKRALAPLTAEEEDIARNKKFAQSLWTIQDATLGLQNAQKRAGEYSVLNEGELAYREKIDAVEEARRRHRRSLDEQQMPKSDDRYQAMERAYDEQIEGLEAVYRKDQELRGNWQAGVEKSFRDYAYAASDSFGQAERLVTSTFKSMEDSLVEFVKTGKLEFEDLVDSILDGLARIVVQKAIAGVVGSIFNTNTGSSTAGVDGNWQVNAKGGAYASPGLSTYANTIVSEPTLFPFANGIGLMGERGAPGEAILPLDRDSRGRLGVVATGGETSNKAPVVYVNVYNESGEKKDASATAKMDYRGMIIDVVLSDVSQNGPIKRALSARSV